MKQRRRTALVLSGGAARGLAHLGVLRGLEEAGIPLDLIVGASFGSIAGAFYARGFTAEQMLHEALDFSLLKVLGPGLPPHLLSRRRLAGYLAGRLPGSFEELELPLRVAVTDISREEIVMLDQGPLIPAILASSAFPGLLPPVRQQGRLLVDGGFVNEFLVAAARARGADVVIFSDVDMLTAMRRNKRWMWLYKTARKRALAGAPPGPGETPGPMKCALAVLRTLEKACVGLDRANPEHAAPECHLCPVQERFPALRFGMAEAAFGMGLRSVEEVREELRTAVWGTGGNR